MSSAPARPASAPDSAIPSQMRREEGMPLAWAASRPAPTARHSKPRTVRVRRNQTAAATASARGNPRSSRLPAKSRGSQAEALTGSVPAMLTMAPEPAAASGPATSHPWTRWMAIQLSRIVLITSCTPRRTFNQPASNPHPAPATAAPSRLRAIAPGRSRCPITAAARAPQMSWPSAPMLNRPTVNATATESPVSTRTADIAQRFVPPAGGPRVESPRRMDGDDQARRTASRELARGHELLLVPAGKVRRPRRRFRRAHVELLDQFLRHLAPSRAIDEKAESMRRLRVAPECQVLLHAERKTERAAAGILGKVGNSRAARRRWVAVKSGVAIESQPTLHGPQPRQDLGELGLAVAVHARHPQDLAASDMERQSPQAWSAALRHAGELAGLQDDCAVARRPPRSGRTGAPAARHRLGELLRVRLGARRHLHQPASPDHRDPISRPEHLTKLVRDEEDRAPLGRQRAHDLDH